MDTDSRFSRLFTIEEANSLLPVIRERVERMKEATRLVREEVEQVSGETGDEVGSPELSAQLEERGVAPRLVQEISGLIDEIHTYGCLVNGPEAGLVDFPCLLGSEIVFLCWQAGETEITHWHRIPDGFAGRKPLLDSRRHRGVVH